MAGQIGFVFKFQGPFALYNTATLQYEVYNLGLMMSMVEVATLAF